MIRTITSLLFTLCCFSAHGQALNNASFNQRDAQGKFTGWSGKGQHIFYDSSRAHTPPGCAHLYNVDYGITQVSQTIPFNPGKYKKYKLKLFVRTEIRNGYADAWVKVTDAKGGFIFQNSIPERLATGKTLWQQYAVDFYGTADVASLEVGVRITGKGKAWFDDVTIEELPAERETTNKIAEKYLGEVSQILQDQCWYRDSVNIKEIYRNSLQFAAKATSTGDCYEALAYMLERVGDPRAQFYDPSTARNWVKRLKKEDSEAAYPEVKLVDSHYVHIYLPGVTAENRNILEKFADTLHHQLLQLDQSAIKGWVVDLRDNAGGNATAMLAAVGPLLSEGTCGRYIRSKETIDWKYSNGVANIDTTTIKVRKAFKAKNTDLPVAVLTSNGTYGAGELVVVAFKGRENSRSFGEKTAGATANEKRILLSDGAMLFFTAGIMCDTKGQRYNGMITADKPVQLIYTEDHCLGKAIQWMKDQHGH